MKKEVQLVQLERHRLRFGMRNQTFVKDFSIRAGNGFENQLIFF